ncbi:Thioredoxin 1 [Buchnera aphidicola (Thelaxes suberi)]|uniref:thioredoxin n=1 Tax=Buchnera aphidicola TaxID=9 RepID=UPI003464B13E
MENNIIIINDNNFQEKVLKENNFILVDFWAPWCNPCKILTPIIEEVASVYKNRIIFSKINVDENPNTAPKYSIRGIPALLLFKKGEVLATKVGVLSKLELTTFLEEHTNIKI